MKLHIWLLAATAMLMVGGCTIKHVQQSGPSGPSYQQQNQSADKAFKEMNQ